MTVHPHADCDTSQIPSDRSSRWLQVVARAAELILVNDVRDADVMAAIELLRQAAPAERVHIQVTPHTAPLDEAQMMLRSVPPDPPATVLRLTDRWRCEFGAGRPVFVDAGHVAADERQALSAQGIDSCVLVPLKIRGILRGCIWLENIDSESAWSPDELAALTAIGIVFGSALEYRELQEYLAQSESRYKRLVENAPDVIFRMALPDGAFEYVSPAATEITGYTPEQILKTPHLIERMIHPGWRGYCEDLWTKVRRGEVPSESAFAIIHGRTGEARWVQQNNMAVRDAQGRLIAIEGIVRDITKQHLAETRLQHREATLQNILSNAPVGIGFNSDRTMLIVSDELCRMTGYTSEELVGRVTDFLYPTYAEFQRVGLDLVAQLEKGIIGTVQTQWVRKDGTVLDILMHANCITPKDYTIGVTFTVIEISAFRDGHTRTE